MPRGYSAGIKTELGGTTFAAPIYCVRIKRKDGTYLRWSERNPTFDDGTGSHAFEARLMNINGFTYSADQAGAVTFTVANVDGQITTLDRAESFAGETLELIAYLPGIDTYYIPWSGYCDDVQQIDAEHAVLQAYPTVANPHTMIPQRTVGIPCTNVFGNIANWVSYKDFDGSECPYQRDASGGTPGNVGFVGTLSGAINNSVTSITAHWAATPLAGGAKWRKADTILIGTEKMQVTNSPADPDGSGNQALTVTRGYKSTTAASHADAATMFFASCADSTEYCKSRGMYGNNPADTYAGGTKKRNYFSGFPFMIGYDYGRYRSSSNDRPKLTRLYFSGNESGYGRTLPLVYGRVRLSDAVLLMAKPEGDFLSTLWAVSEGVLATNATDDDQTTPSNAYLKHPSVVNGTTYQVENIYINGESRHDPRPGYGIELYNGTQDQQEPSGAFITGISDFSTNNLGFWGTARVCLRINTKSNPSVDVQGQSITGAFEIAYGRLVRVYSDTVTFSRKATTNPAWVIADVMTSKRAGGGLDHGRLNLQSLIDFAAYCDATVTSSFDGSTVKRWTFNGIIDQRRSYDEWIHLTSIGAYCLPPFIDKDGKRKFKALKSESTSGVPLFSSKVASTTARNIIWENDRSSLVKARRPIAEVPNEIRVNYVELGKIQFVSTLHANINGTSDPVTVTARWALSDVALGAKFRQNDVILIDSEQLLITNSPADPNGSGDQTLTCQRAYASTAKAAHTAGATIQFQSDHAKVSVVIADRESQTDLGTKLGDQSRRAVTKSIDLPGTSSLDEAARIATLILRAGEFAQGGLSNNLKVTFKAFYRDAEDLEIGDIIQVEDDLLDAASNEQYFRVMQIAAQPMPVNDGGFVFVKEIQAVLHDNGMYDDTALTVSKFDRIDAAGSNDKEPPAVTGFSVTESGYVDANGTATTKLVISYTEPNPKENFRSVSIYRSYDDGAGNPIGFGTGGDGRFIEEVLASGQTIEYEVSGKYEHFCAVSRTLSGHPADPESLQQDGTYKYPRVRILVDGKADSPLPAPTGLAAYGRLDAVYLEWNAYTGNNAQLLKRFNVYRGTTSDPNVSTKIAEVDSNRYRDDSDTVLNNPATVYYYFVRGVSKLENVVIDGVTLDGLSSFSSEAHDNPGTDSGVPNAPTVNVVRSTASQSTSTDYSIIVGAEPPGSPSNYDTVERWQLQIATDSGFSSLLFDEEIARGLPDIVDFRLNAAGTYYFRARAINIFGNGAWSSTFTYNTEIGVVDTDIPPVPVGLALVTSSAGNPIPGNGYQTQLELPATQIASEYASLVIWHDSSTLPTTTTAETPRTNGTLVPGSNRLTVPGTPWTASQWVSPDAHDIVYFSPYRSGSPWELEGMIGLTKITGNGTNYIDFDFAPSRQEWNLSGNVTFWIVKRGVGNHFLEKVKAYLYTPDNHQIRGVRRINTDLQLATVYTWAAIYNLNGLGKLAGPSSSASFSGIASLEIKGSAVINSKLGAGAVTFDKISVTALSAINADLGTITAGTVTGATIRTAALNARIEMDSTNGLRAYDTGGNLHARIPLDASQSLLATFIQPVSTSAAAGVNIQNGDATSFIACRGTAFVMEVNSSAYKARLDSGGFRLLSAQSFEVPDGQGLKNSSANASIALPSGAVECYVSSTLQAQFDNAPSSTQTAMLLLGDGSLRRVAIDNSNLGTGAKRYLYLV